MMPPAFPFVFSFVLAATANVEIKPGSAQQIWVDVGDKRLNFNRTASAKEIRVQALAFAIDHDLTTGLDCIQSALCVADKITQMALTHRGDDSQALKDTPKWASRVSTDSLWLPQDSGSEAYEPGADRYLCPAVAAMFPLISTNDIYLNGIMNKRSWKPSGKDGRDPTRFSPTRKHLINDLYQGQNPYASTKPFFPEEYALYSGAYLSNAQRSANVLRSTVLAQLGSPPRLVVEVGAFIGSGAVNVWGTLALLPWPSDDEQGIERLVLCVDSWQPGGSMRLGGHNRLSTGPKLLPLSSGGFPAVGEDVFMRRIASEQLTEIVYPLPIPAQAGARLLYLLGYRVDVVYLDTAHERGETLAEAHLYFQLLRPGGLLVGDDIDTVFEAVNQDIRIFAKCQNATLEKMSDGFHWFIRKPIETQN